MFTPFRSTALGERSNHFPKQYNVSEERRSIHAPIERSISNKDVRAKKHCTVNSHYRSENHDRKRMSKSPKHSGDHSRISRRSELNRYKHRNKIPKTESTASGNSTKKTTTSKPPIIANIVSTPAAAIATDRKRKIRPGITFTEKKFNKDNQIARADLTLPPQERRTERVEMSQTPSTANFSESLLPTSNLERNNTNHTADKLGYFFETKFEFDDLPRSWDKYTGYFEHKLSGLKVYNSRLMWRILHLTTLPNQMPLRPAIRQTVKEYEEWKKLNKTPQISR